MEFQWNEIFILFDLVFDCNEQTNSDGCNSHQKETKLRFAAYKISLFGVFLVRIFPDSD